MCDRETFTSFSATRIAAARAYQMAGISPQDIDFAEVHDAFTPFEIISSEDLGFFDAGRGGDAVLDGRTARDGDLPINPSGGLKSRGHPVGASGLAQIVEAVKILRGESGLKKKFARGLTQSTGGLATNNFVTILERADAPAARRPAASVIAPVIAAQRRTLDRPVGDKGKIETFTTLYVTPDGFLPPLALALVRDCHGHLLMAQGEDHTQLKIGQEVYLRRFDGTCYFTVKSQIQKVQEAFTKLFRRKEAMPSNDGGGGNQT
jgi:hypothetical protein